MSIEEKRKLEAEAKESQIRKPVSAEASETTGKLSKEVARKSLERIGARLEGIRYL